MDRGSGFRGAFAFFDLQSQGKPWSPRQNRTNRELSDREASHSSFFNALD